MIPGVNLEHVLDVLADKVAQRLRADGTTLGGASIRPRLLTVEQAATYLGRTVDAVQHMISARRLPVVRDGRRVFLDLRELDGWITRNSEPAEDAEY